MYSNSTLKTTVTYTIYGKNTCKKLTFKTGFYTFFDDAHLLQDKTIKHENTGNCLQRPDPSDMNLPLLRACDYSPGQQWIMKSEFKWQAHKRNEDR